MPPRTVLPPPVRRTSASPPRSRRTRRVRPRTRHRARRICQPRSAHRLQSAGDHLLRQQPIIFTTNKSPFTQWGELLHDPDLAEAIVDRTLERGCLQSSSKDPRRRPATSGETPAMGRPWRPPGFRKTAARIPETCRRRREGRQQIAVSNVINQAADGGPVGTTLQQHQLQRHRRRFVQRWRRPVEPADQPGRTLVPAR